jgi:hypothetical protein
VAHPFPPGSVSALGRFYRNPGQPIAHAGSYPALSCPRARRKQLPGCGRRLRVRLTPTHVGKNARRERLAAPSSVCPATSSLAYRELSPPSHAPPWARRSHADPDRCSVRRTMPQRSGGRRAAPPPPHSIENDPYPYCSSIDRLTPLWYTVLHQDKPPKPPQDVGGLR